MVTLGQPLRAGNMMPHTVCVSQQPPLPSMQNGAPAPQCNAGTPMLGLTINAQPCRIDLQCERHGAGNHLLHGGCRRLQPPRTNNLPARTLSNTALRGARDGRCNLSGARDNVPDVHPTNKRSGAAADAVLMGNTCWRGEV